MLNNFKIYKRLQEGFTGIDVLLSVVFSSFIFLGMSYVFIDITEKLITILKLNEFKILKSKKPNNLAQIIRLNRYVRLKTRALCVKSKDNV